MHCKKCVFPYTFSSVRLKRKIWVMGVMGVMGSMGSMGSWGSLVMGNLS